MRLTGCFGVLFAVILGGSNVMRDRSLFVKTIDTTNVWGTGRGMTPGRWLMDLSTLHIPAIRDLAGCTLFATLPPPFSPSWAG